MRRLAILVLALVVGAGVVLAYVLTEPRRRAHRAFVDACKQEQPVERCELLWLEGGAP